MSDIITVTDLSKTYRIHHDQARYKSFRDEIGNFFKQPFSKDSDEKFYALKNVSFSIKQGETVGIIGSNGAGKSTLLKILSRITLPTKGEVRLKGRVSSLLEVGTGFHPELTGRENIFLNGAILGMTQKEIKGKFDEIVDFAEVEKFLDTPVKHFSSGMYMRLAFAVAAHLEPEILIVDEVLAVGDAKFQKKCMGKMRDVGKEGRTVIFVSHNMAAIQSLCQRTILLDTGIISHYGKTSDVINIYLSETYEKKNAKINLNNKYLKRNRLENSKFYFTQLEIKNAKGEYTTFFNLLEPFELIIHGIANEPIENMVIGFGLLSSMGFAMFNSYTSDSNIDTSYPAGELVFNMKMRPNNIAPGTYIIDLSAMGIGVTESIQDVVTITISSVAYNSSINLRSNYGGIMIPFANWNYKKILSTKLQ